MIHSLFAEKRKRNSIQWLRQPNPNHKLWHYRSIPCPNTLVGSVRCLITLLKYSLSYYIVESYTQHLYTAELYPVLTCCWGRSSLSIMLSNSQFQSIAELYPILLHWRGIPSFKTLVRWTLIHYITELYPILTHCWGLFNLIRLLSDILSYNIVNLSPILKHCCQFSRNVFHSQSESTLMSPNITNKYQPDWITNRQPNT